MFGRCLILALLFALIGVPAVAKDDHTLYQTSIINALLQGVYDGSTTIGALKRHGDFGLGTVNGLDGELIGLDGIFYQIKSDGSVHRLGDDVGVPFAAVTFFHQTDQIKIAAIDNLVGFCALLDQKLVNTNTVVSLRIHGHFSYVKTRSVPRQQPPYRPLAEVVKEQSLFEFKDIVGTLIGFRTPAYLQGVNVPGYHLHFLSDDSQSGGHVLDVRFDEADVNIDYEDSIQVDLPKSKEFRELNFNQDLKDALRRVEQEPTAAQ